MARIHTHYDNLKVARGAPQEVIRAAYKALSQKYHPDKNPGEDKAARIMAIINSAYNTLSDPLRRREHDEWIAAEEWEIAWLESTRLEDGRPIADKHAPMWEDPHVEAPAAPPTPYRILRDVRWWAAMALCLTMGGVAGALLMGQTREMPVALAGPMGRTESRASAPPRHERDAWASTRSAAAENGQELPQIRTLGVTELVVPARAPECGTELHSLISPNGSPWPAQSGYLEGFPVGNQGSAMELTVDNTANGSPILVKVFDMERRSNIRHVYVLARDSMTIDQLAAGKYEVRYQNIDVGGDKAQCLARSRRAVLAGDDGANSGGAKN